MECLKKSYLLQIETREQWEDVLEKYGNHCNGCKNLLQRNKAYIEQKIQNLEKFHQELWNTEAKETVRTESENIESLVEYVPELFQEIVSLNLSLDTWQTCQEVIQELKKISWNNQEERREIAYQILWQIVAQKDLERKKFSSVLPENWQEEIQEKLGQKNVLSLFDGSKGVFLDAYDTEEIRMAAEDDEGYEAMIRKITSRRRKYRKPLWKEEQNGIEVKIFYHEGHLHCSVFSHQEGELEVNYETGYGRKSQIPGRQSLSLDLGTPSEFDKEWKLQIVLNGKLCYQKTFYGFKNKE